MMSSLLFWLVIAWTVEQAGAIIVAVRQQLLEFAVCYLEKSEFNSDDFSLQVCRFEDFFFGLHI